MFLGDKEPGETVDAKRMNWRVFVLDTPTVKPVNYVRSTKRDEWVGV
jgi:hypothetical protein